MNESLRVVCFKNAEEIAAYVREDPKRINLLVADENLPAWKRNGIGPWRALNIDLDQWMVGQRDKHYHHRETGTASHERRGGSR